MPTPHDPAERRDAMPASLGPEPVEAVDGGKHPRSVRDDAKGFVLNVSAALPRGVGDAAGRALRVDAPHGIADDIEFPREGEQSAPAVAAAVADDESDASDAAPPWNLEDWPVVRSVTARQKRRRIAAAQSEPSAHGATAENAGEPSSKSEPRGERPRRWSAWSLSCVVHGVMAVALSLVTIAQIQPRAEMDLVMAPEAIEDLQLADRVLDPADAAGDQLGGLVNETAAAVVDPGTPTLGMDAGSGIVGELTDEVALVGGGGGGADSGPPGGLGGAGGLFGDGTGGLADYGTGLGGAATAQFFGTKIEGRRIVFVLDNSGSMQQGRLEAVIAELQRCVESLDENQEFYVAFYSDVAYPLFYPNPAENYIRPTARNKQRLAAWLDTVELCLGDAVVDALAGAISIEPDTVFLLSDGRIQGEKKMAFLLGAGGGEFPIHTVGVGLSAGATTSRENLQQIASANGGDFREAEVPAEMQQLARDKPRPYHNKGPGPVWGRNVKAWGRR
jgi:hypothetical protein